MARLAACFAAPVRTASRPGRGDDPRGAQAPTAKGDAMGKARDWQRSARWGRRTTGLLMTTLLVLTTLLLGAGVASAVIFDDDAPPSWEYVFHGLVAGNDKATDAAKTATATWVVGQMDNGATNLDASLIRLPNAYLGGDVHSWNSPADSNDANYDVAARGSYVYSAGATRNASDNLDLLLIRWSSTTGAVKWARRYAGADDEDDIATDVVIDPDGNAIVCGTTQHTLIGGTDWVVRKYSPLGDKKWTWTYDGPIDIDLDAPVEMVVDGAGNIYVTGTLITAEYESVAYTVKLSPAGKKLWGRKFVGPEPSPTSASAIVRCPSGGVYVGGTTWTTATGDDMFLLRYTAAGERTIYDYYGLNGATAQRLNDIAVASTGRIVGVGQHDDNDPTLVTWMPQGYLYSTSIDDTPGADEWLAVATDPYGGLYRTGPFDNVSVNPNIRTQRLSLLAGGGGWTYDYDDNGYPREVSAIAVNGLTCAVVGSVYNGVDYDQYVHIWAY